jgi:NAD(P)-dependent dehydrogenase (short-subunit alcohol dehydrogenase family)
LDHVLVEHRGNRRSTHSQAIVLGIVRLYLEIMKKLLVTGASRGIGRATALELVKMGASVHATSRTDFTLQGCTTHVLDHSDPDSVAQLRNSLSGVLLDGIVLNAGALISKPFRELTPRDFQTMALANWSGPALLVQELLPLLAPGAHIVFISSMGGFQGASKYPGLLAYATSKMAMAGLAECLQAELGPEGFVFNTLCLGAVQTEMLTEAFPGYQAPVTPETMGSAVAHFALHGHKTQAGQVIPMAMSNP